MATKLLRSSARSQASCLGDDHEAAAVIGKMSPVAWQHVNLFGTFEFSDEEFSVDMEALAAKYSDSNFWKRAMRDSEGGESV